LDIARQNHANDDESRHRLWAKSTISTRLSLAEKIDILIIMKKIL